MEYISTRNTKKTFSFRDVFLKGLASDGGLFVPKTIPSYAPQELEKFRNLSYEDLAAKIIFKFCSDEFDEKEIKDFVKNSYKNFGNMAKEFGSNWKKIKDTAKKKQKILDQYK